MLFSNLQIQANDVSLDEDVQGFLVLPIQSVPNFNDLTLLIKAESNEKIKQNK